MKSDDIQTTYGYRIKFIQSESEPQIALYMDLKGNKRRISIYSDLQNLELAHEVNAELCLKSRLLNPQNNGEFLLMEECLRSGTDLWLIHEYFPEHNRLSNLAPLNFTKAYELETQDPLLDQMERVIFSSTKAVLDMHRQNISWGQFNLNNIIFSPDGHFKVTGFKHCKIDDIQDPTPQEPNTISAQFNSGGNSFQQDIFNLGILFFLILSGPKAPHFLHSLNSEIPFEANTNFESTLLPFPKNFFWIYDLFHDIIIRPDINEVIKRLAFGFWIPIEVVFEDDLQTELQIQRSSVFFEENKQFEILMQDQRDSLRDGSFFENNVPFGRTTMDLKDLGLNNAVQDSGLNRTHIEQHLKDKRFYIQKMSFRNPITELLDEHFYMKTISKIKTY